MAGKRVETVSKNDDQSWMSHAQGSESASDTDSNA